jgi:hypothetical protein
MGLDARQRPARTGGHMTTIGRTTIGLMALVCAGTVRAQVCPGDFNGDQVVTVNEILVSVRYALYGCPGPGPRLVDNGDGTVTDNETGLMWEQKTDDGGIHDATNRYSWSNGEPWQPVGTAFATHAQRLYQP